MSRPEEITFGGMTEEAFLAGTNMLNTYVKAGEPTRIELTPHLLRALGYEIPMAEADEHTLGAVAEAADEISHRANEQLRMRKIRELAGEPYDLDY